MIASTATIGLIPEPYGVKYGGHADQRSHEFPAMDQFRIRSLVKILKEGNLSEAQAACARQMLEFKSKIFISGARKRGKMAEAGEIEKILL